MKERVPSNIGGKPCSLNDLKIVLIARVIQEGAGHSIPAVPLGTFVALLHSCESLGLSFEI